MVAGSVPRDSIDYVRTLVLRELSQLCYVREIGHEREKQGMHTHRPETRTTKSP